VILLFVVVWLLCGALAALWDVNRLGKLAVLDIAIAACLVLVGPLGLLIHRAIYRQ
jgi:hypothetical protein